MKTNAMSKTVLKAVENVSANYGGNVIFKKTPERVTKNVSRFTLSTKDANASGSLVTKAGQKQARASWKVHEDVMAEIFRLEPKPSVFCDTVYGRQYGHGTVIPLETALEAVEIPKVKKGKVMTKVAELDKGVRVIIKALKHLLKHPELVAS